MIWALWEKGGLWFWLTSFPLQEMITPFSRKHDVVLVIVYVIKWVLSKLSEFWQNASEITSNFMMKPFDCLIVGVKLRSQLRKVGC